ncbi:MAG: hypothetical protein A2056_04540 [Deltaproteobacteria bacterium GWA2_42_85]|nr:MAG: hypothetical protein A2056_04540 [Deltaproteobacteria bacterium GWA2_42_85]OGP38506.1 MAG: hypothetical protein A2090_01420 [Deltaproteobacteria bacterium GWD2_42_10]OGP48171.1 MAG: hypothetical protein A2022_10450 [Deltaproteobacteria bacterium GWF2_42_12]OGQ67451.1 MAG: hypothetical protein A3F88_03875 [Deltaproteobacteria bacterium RIFCSPLOWO2_12_FULL_42_16]OGQ73360.1 MAG: hypothetical protein A2235_02705 [Deltaproteobacteria bacterium RIFOXYA2_FULL_42_10]
MLINTKAGTTKKAREKYWGLPLQIVNNSAEIARRNMAKTLDVRKTNNFIIAYFIIEDIKLQLKDDENMH